jgi:hypothetical protein
MLIYKDNRKGILRSRQMRQMPHFWNGKCNLLKVNKKKKILKICLNSPPLPHFMLVFTIITITSDK